MFMEWKEEDESGETEIGKQREVRWSYSEEPMTKNNFRRCWLSLSDISRGQVEWGLENASSFAD